MQIGDRVSIRRSFQPTPTGVPYRYGVVAALVFADSSPEAPTLREVLLYLYDPEQDGIYTDELGSQVMYSFYPEELELG